jgi:hypothetical protein
MRRIVFDPFHNERADCHRGKEPNALHPLSDRRHQLHTQLIGNLIETKGIERTLARSGWIVASEERQGSHEPEL